jgi:V/A-type H+/Na+-transporting ATPase subunit F
MIGYVIGDSDMVTGFSLVGVEGIEATSVDEAREALNKVITRNDIGIIIISESFLTNLPLRAEIDKMRQERITPLIVALPGSMEQPHQTQLSSVITKILGVKV